jgi:hypothetical protein
MQYQIFFLIMSLISLSILVLRLAYSDIDLRNAYMDSNMVGFLEYSWRLSSHSRQAFDICQLSSVWYEY